MSAAAVAPAVTWHPRRKPLAPAEVQTMQNNPDNTAHQVLENQLAVLRHLCAVNGVPVPDWALADPKLRAPMHQNSAPVKPVLRASNPDSFRAAKSRHKRNVRETFGGCADPENCIVCSGKTPLWISAKAKRSRNVRGVDKVLAGTSDAPRAHVRERASSLRSEENKEGSTNVDPKKAPPVDDVTAARQVSQILEPHMSASADTILDACLHPMTVGVPVKGQRQRVRRDPAVWVAAAHSWADSPPELDDPKKAWGYFLQMVATWVAPIEALPGVQLSAVEQRQAKMDAKRLEISKRLGLAE